MTGFSPLSEARQGRAGADRPGERGDRADHQRCSTIPRHLHPQPAGPGGRRGTRPQPGAAAEGAGRRDHHPRGRARRDRSARVPRPERRRGRGRPLSGDRGAWRRWCIRPRRSSSGRTRSASAGTLEITPDRDAAGALHLEPQPHRAGAGHAALSITEEFFDPNLNPIRAKVSLSLRVLSASTTSASRHRGGGLFMAYLQPRSSSRRARRALRSQAFGVGEPAMKNPIQAMFEAGIVERPTFRPRAATTASPVRDLHRGRTGAPIAYLARRFAPPPERFATLGHRVVAEGERLDQIAATADRRPGAVLAALRRQRRGLAGGARGRAARESALTLPHGRARRRRRSHDQGHRPHRAVRARACRCRRRASVVDALQSVKVEENAGETQSGFELVFAIEKNSPLNTLFLLAGGAAIPILRVRWSPRINGRPTSLINGVVDPGRDRARQRRRAGDAHRQGQGPDGGDGRSSTSPACPIRRCRRSRAWR